MLATLLIVPPAAGSDAEEYAPLLIPVYVVEVPGAYGSRWRSELRAFADTDRDVVVFPQADPCQGILCAPFPPSETCCALPRRLPWAIRPFMASNPGLLMYTRKSDLPLLTFNLRIRDVSEQAGSAGTEIPLVRESDFFTTNLQLINIPVGQSFRNRLRVYDVDAVAGASVGIQIIDLYNNLLHERVVTFTVDQSARDQITGAPTLPGYIELPVEEQFPPNPPAPLREIRIQIEPRSPGLRFWAFVATTDNETQQVTVVTPR